MKKLLIAVVLSVVLFIASCGRPPEGYFTMYTYYVEVVNRTESDIFMSFEIYQVSSSEVLDGDVFQVVAKSTSEKIKLGGLNGPDSKPNALMWHFDSITWKDPSSSQVFKQAYYPSARDEDKGERIYYLHGGDGITKERLFEPSESRPFYLEQDTEDPTLGRIIITGVPY